MDLVLTDSFVIAALAAALAQAPSATPQQLNAITDPEAYAVYAAVLPREWGNVSKAALLLQQETETSSTCSFPVQDVAWEVVERNFKAENARAQLLRPMLRLDIPYRLVARAEI